MNQLLSSALAGDPAALEGLIHEIWPRCYRLAAAVIGDRALAQDAAQESCAIVYVRLRSLRDRSAFDAWLYRIVMREATRVRRRIPANVPLYDDASFAPDETTSIDVWRALAQLPEDQRDAVVLFYFHDLRTEDIAAIVDVPHATVRTRLMRARERLRASLGDYANDLHVQQGEVQHYAV